MHTQLLSSDDILIEINYRIIQCFVNSLTTKSHFLHQYICMIYFHVLLCNPGCIQYLYMLTTIHTSLFLYIGSQVCTGKLASSKPTATCPMEASAIYKQEYGIWQRLCPLGNHRITTAETGLFIINPEGSLYENGTFVINSECSLYSGLDTIIKQE